MGTPINNWIGFGSGAIVYPKAWHPYKHSATIALTSSNLNAAETAGAPASALGTPLLAITPGMHKFFEIAVGSFFNGMAIGVADASLSVNRNLGDDIHSWGYVSFLGAPYLCHNSAGTLLAYPGSPSSYFVAHDKVGVEADYTQSGGTTCSLTFWLNGVSQGVAFTGLTGTLYPAIGTIVSNNFNALANFEGPIIVGSLPAGASFF